MRSLVRQLALVLALAVIATPVWAHTARELQATFPNAPAPSGSLIEKAKVEDDGGRTVCQFSIAGKHFDSNNPLLPPA